MTTNPKVKKTTKKTGTRPRYIWGLVAGTIMIIIAIAIYTYVTSFRALAVFNGGNVTREEFTTALRLETGKYDPLVWKDERQSLKIKKDILNEIVQENILLTKAKDLGISVSDEELATELNSFKSGYTDDTFKKMLELKGISYADWADKKKNKLLVQKLIEKDVFDKMEIPQSEISKYYNDHTNEFSHPEQVRARHILSSTWEEAQAIEKEISDGGNFAEIAKAKSISPERWNGGDLGYFSRGTYPEVFDRTCFNLQVADTSPVVKSDYGYHIFKILDKRGPAKESLIEAKPRIIAQIKRAQSKDGFEKWYKPIYDSANVKINDNLLKQIEVTINDENARP